MSAKFFLPLFLLILPLVTFFFLKSKWLSLTRGFGREAAGRAIFRFVFWISLSLVVQSSISGCAKLAHLQELLTLKNFSDNRDAQDVYVENQDKLFEDLLKAVQQNNLAQGLPESSMVKSFGHPVLVRQVQRDGKMLTQWLYRYPTKAFNSPKVYVYFNARKNLESWEYIPQDHS